MKECNICREIGTTCRETIPLVQGRFYKKGKDEVLVFEKIKDCAIYKAYEKLQKPKSP